MATDNQLALSRPPRIPTTNVPRNARQGVPAFLQKLYEMLNNTENQDLIRWSDAGDSFYVLDPDRFAKEVLGRWFKHQNFASFVRQLNMYGFHKVPHLQQGVLRSEGDTEFWNFEHPNFRRSQPDLLCLIQRKKQNTQQPTSNTPAAGVITTGPGGAGEEGILDVRDPVTLTQQNIASTATTPSSGQVLDVPSILQAIKAITRHQTTISEDLTQLKQSNQLLWQETLSARDRLQKQQDMINRIVKFLAGVFGNHGEGAGHGHGHTGHPHHPHEKRDNDPTRTNEGAVVPVARSGHGSGAMSRRGRARLMIEGPKQDPSGKVSTGPRVGLVEVLDQEAGGHYANLVGDEDGDDDGLLVDCDDEDEDMSMNTLGGDAGTNAAYAVETPASVPSPSPSVAQSDVQASTMAETATNNILPALTPSTNDTVMHDSIQPSSSHTKPESAVLERAVTPSRLTSTSPALGGGVPFEVDPRTLQSTLSNMSPEYFATLLAFLSQSDSNSTTVVDPGLGFPVGGQDGGQLTPFAGGGGGGNSGGNAPSPTNFDFSSLGLPGFPPSGGTTNFPMITGFPSLDQTDSSSSVPAPMGAVSPKLDSHWRDVQDVDNDVAASESQINELMETLAPLFGGATGLNGHILSSDSSSSTNTNVGSTPGNGAVAPSLASTGAVSLNLTTKDFQRPSTGSGSGDVETDISSLDPTHLSIPTNLHHPDFNFDSFFATSSSPSSTLNISPTKIPSHGRNNQTNLHTTNPSGIIDATMNMNMSLDHPHDLSHFGGAADMSMSEMSSSFPTGHHPGGIGGYNDLSGAETAFLDEVPSPVASTKLTIPGTTTTTTGSPKQIDKSNSGKQGSGGTTSRKRKSNAMAMDELEGALLGAAASGGENGASGVSAVGGVTDEPLAGAIAEAGAKAKRRKD